MYTYARLHTRKKTCPYTIANILIHSYKHIPYKHTCIYTHTHIQRNVHTHTYTQTYTYTHKYTHANTCIHAHMQTDRLAHAHAHTHTDTPTHAYTHLYKIYIHTYIHKDTQTPRRPAFNYLIENIHATKKHIRVNKHTQTKILVQYLYTNYIPNTQSI